MFAIQYGQNQFVMTRKATGDVIRQFPSRESADAYLARAARNTPSLTRSHRVVPFDAAEARPGTAVEPATLRSAVLDSIDHMPAPLASVVEPPLSVIDSDVLRHLFVCRNLREDQIANNGTPAEIAAMAKLVELLESTGRGNYSTDMKIGHIIAWAFTN